MHFIHWIIPRLGLSSKGWLNPLLLVLPAILVSCGRGSQDGAPSNTAPSAGADPAPTEQFLALMNVGKGYLDQGDSTNAIRTYEKAVSAAPQNADARLNLATSHLLAGDAAAAIREGEKARQAAPNSAAAYFIIGSAHLRLGQAEAAVKALENARTIDPGEIATYFQLGRARMELKQWNEAVTAFREGLALDPNRLHAPIHFLVGQALLRAGRADEAREELAQHQMGRETDGAAVSVATFERSRYTQARVPFRLEQPDGSGIAVQFIDATAEALGTEADRYLGPVGLVEPDKSGSPSLFVLERGVGFRWLRNDHGAFVAQEPTFPAQTGVPHRVLLVGDLQNDRFEDVIALGDQGSQVFQFTTNGALREVTSQTALATLRASDGLLVDLDFTGKLDLVSVVSPSGSVRIFRQLGPFRFAETTEAAGIPQTLRDVREVHMDDWNSDGLADLTVSRTDGVPMLFEKIRGGPLTLRTPSDWVSGSVACSGDFDNDLRPDLAVLNGSKLVVCLAAGGRREIDLPTQAPVRRLVALDHDNDGWLDLWAVGEGLRAWRNGGLSGFQECSRALGLDRLSVGAVASIHVADFDSDCDPDLVVALASGGLRFLRNEGGNAHQMVKVHLLGNRSNASGLGCKVEIEAGGLRLLRTVRQWPVEIGVGRHQRLDALLVHWLNWPQGTTETPVRCEEPILAVEATIQEGSCPYLYAWDGTTFRFITDILGAAPLGLPVAEGRYIEPDPEELVRIGNEASFPPRQGHRVISITEELREVLYLDDAKLVVVDREPDVEVHATDKLLPAGPYPPGSLWTLENEHALQHAETLEGRDVTDLLRAVDARRASPPQLRIPQLRGLAEPHGYILDFGPLDSDRPYVLVMNGWLRFGGGMANMAASHDPNLPFPFPELEAESATGEWRRIDVVVGAPAGKTKTILVDLEGRLPHGSRRLRIRHAFEIHWDRIALLEKSPRTSTRIAWVAPATAQLRPHGFGPLQSLPPDWPATPDYDGATPDSLWTIIPEGWTTRHGDVLELVARRDEALVLIHSGDELVLEFAEAALPNRVPGSAREFFLYVDGWDKDSDFHIAAGTTVGPLPFHGMDAQRYGSEARPPFPSDALHLKYNTRWVDGSALKRTARR
ncbi:MAG: VCBS repeat-containing protein [Verrucomicrobiales bacterium]|nr:VCBS repeat-containing protein [Verrucomicrobiales bacterium]